MERQNWTRIKAVLHWNIIPPGVTGLNSYNSLQSSVSFIFMFFFYQKWESMIPSPLCPHGFWCSLIFGDGLNYAGCFVKNHEISPWISYSIAIFPSIHVFFSELITVFVGRSPSARYLWTMPGASLLRSGLTGRTWSRVACAKNEGIGCMNQQGLHMNQQ